MGANRIKLREQFTVDLVHLSRRWRWCLDRRLSETGLTQARWTTLLQIARGGEGMTQKQLAEHMGIEGASLVPLLDSLSKRGLVERRVHPTDRRLRTIHLMPAAEPVLNAIESIADELRAELTQDISNSDLQACLRVFRRIQGRIPEAAVMPGSD